MKNSFDISGNSQATKTSEDDISLERLVEEAMRGIRDREALRQFQPFYQVHQRSVFSASEEDVDHVIAALDAERDTKGEEFDRFLFTEQYEKGEQLEFYWVKWEGM